MHAIAVADSLLDLIEWLRPDAPEPTERAMAGLMHVADVIQCLRWLREANTKQERKRKTAAQVRAEMA